MRLVYRGMRCRGGTIEPAYHMRGKTVLDGVVREVVLVDADADGTYSGKRDRWVAMRADRAAKLKALARPSALLLSEPQIPFEKDGRAISVDRVQPDGKRLVLVLDKPRVPMRKVLARRYAEVRAAHFEAFEEEMADFVLSKQMDVRRTRTEKPARWRDIPLSDAKKLARKENKPLLVAFYTESNPWCYRYEFYTFSDAEVDSLLRRFILVRIDAEKDPERAYNTFSVRGLPALMPLRHDGRPVSFRLRSRGKDGKVSRNRWAFRLVVLALRLLNALGLRRRRIPNRDLRVLDEETRKALRGSDSHEEIARRYSVLSVILRHTPTVVYLQQLLTTVAPLPPLEEIAVPVLVLQSTGVTFADPAVNRAEIERLPRVDVVPIDANHWPLTESPVAVREAIETWIARQLTGNSGFPR